MASLALLLLASSLLGATCENQEFFLPVRLTLDEAPPLAPQVTDVIHPYRGLNSLDFRLTNTGQQTARYGVAASTCRRCNFDLDCGSETELDELELSCDPERSFCRTGDDPDRCLTPHTVGPLELAPGEVIAGRFNEAQMGLGDQVHVEFLCLPSETSPPETCSGTLDVILILRQVECRSDSDCSSGEICDTQMGICSPQIKPEEGCAQMSGRIPAKQALVGLWAAAVVTLLLVTRRRRRPVW